MPIVTAPFLLAAVLLPVLALSGCRTGAAGGGFAARDSAGIRVTESAAPAWAPGGEWTVDARPSVSIGAEDGPAAYQLHRVQGATRLSDGTLLVADGGAGQVRFYDAAGRHLRSVGGEGKGPKEYRVLAGLHRGPGDTLAVWDFGGRRVTFLGPDGTLARTVALRGTEGMFPAFHGVAADGRVVVSSGFSPVLLMEARSGERRDSVSFLLYGPDGALTDTLGRFGGTEGYLVRTDTDFGMHPVVFGRSVLFALEPRGLWVGDNDRWEIVRYGVDGRPQHVVRRVGEPRPAGRGAVEAHWSARYAALESAAPEDRARTQAQLRSLRAELPVRSTFPFFSRLEVDAEGNLWARDYPPPGNTGGVAWSVFDPAGRWLGEVRMPPGLEVVEIGSDWVLGTWRDELDVPYVRMHPLRKDAVRSGIRETDAG